MQSWTGEANYEDDDRHPVDADDGLEVERDWNAPWRRWLTAGEMDSPELRATHLRRSVRSVVTNLLHIRRRPVSSTAQHAADDEVLLPTTTNDGTTAPDSSCPARWRWLATPLLAERVAHDAVDALVLSGAVTYTNHMQLTEKSVAKRTLCLAACAIEASVAYFAPEATVFGVYGIRDALIAPYTGTHDITRRDLRAARTLLAEKVFAALARQSADSAESSLLVVTEESALHHVRTGLTIFPVGLDAARIVLHRVLLAANDPAAGQVMDTTSSQDLFAAASDPATLTLMLLPELGSSATTLQEQQLIEAITLEVDWTLTNAYSACGNRNRVHRYRSHIASRPPAEMALVGLLAVLLSARANNQNTTALLTPIDDPELVKGLVQQLCSQLTVNYDNLPGALAMARDVRRFDGSLAPTDETVMPRTHATCFEVDRETTPSTRRPWDRNPLLVSALKHEEGSEADDEDPASRGEAALEIAYKRCIELVRNPLLQGSTIVTKSSYVHGCWACTLPPVGSTHVPASPLMIRHARDQAVLPFIVAIGTVDNQEGSRFPLLTMLSKHNGGPNATDDEGIAASLSISKRVSTADPRCPSCAVDDSPALRNFKPLQLRGLLFMAAAGWPPSRVLREAVTIHNDRFDTIMHSFSRRWFQPVRPGRPPTHDAYLHGRRLRIEERTSVDVDQPTAYEELAAWGDGDLVIDLDAGTGVGDESNGGDWESYILPSERRRIITSMWPTVL
jgi:hypothetical protein